MKTMEFNKNKLTEAIDVALQSELISYNEQLLSVLPETFESKVASLSNDYTYRIDTVLQKLELANNPDLQREKNLGRILGVSEENLQKFDKDYEGYYTHVSSFSDIHAEDDDEFHISKFDIMSGHPSLTQADQIALAVKNIWNKTASNDENYSLAA